MFNSNVICTAVYNYMFNIEATCGMVILAGPVIFLKFTVKKTKSTVKTSSHKQRDRAHQFG